MKYIIILLVLLVFTYQPVESASIPLGIKGFVDISYGQIKLSSRDQETYKQQYSLNWQKRYFSNVTLRSSYLYTKNDVYQNSDMTAWKEEQRPTIGFTWSTDQFTIGSTGSYKQDRSNSAVLETNRTDWSVYIKTKTDNIPKLSIRYYWNHFYNDKIRTARNTKENKVQFEIYEDYKRSLFKYLFSRRYNNNLTNDIRTTQYQHNFRFGNTSYLDDSKLLITTNYSLSYSTQKDIRPVSGTDYTFIQFSEALYKETSSFLLDSLQRNPSLNDGNSDLAAQPIINVGGTSINHNIGIDFGFHEKISAIYLYVDRFSDNSMDWQVYISDDNFNWFSYFTNPQVIFNEGYNRFEIFFPNVETRYIKVVNTGISNIENTLVTEIRALTEEQVDVETKRSNSSHLLNVNSRYKFSEKVTSSLNASYQHQSGRANDSDRDNLYYSFGSRFMQSEIINHSIKWNQNFQFFNGASLDVSNYSASYLFLLTPIERLEFSFSTYFNRDFIDHKKNNTNSSYLVNTKGTPLTNLHFSGEISYSKSNQNLSNDVFKTWNQRVSIDGKVNRAISVTLSWSHRTTDTKLIDNSTELTQYQGSFRYRFTRTIFMRGSVQLNENDTRFLTQDFQIGWNPSRKLTINGQVKIQDDDNLFKTKKYNTQVNYKLKGSTNIFASYFVSDLIEAGGERTESIRVGFRSTL